jgi:precorrin-6B methylase 2
MERWAQRIMPTQKLKVGLVWAGNPQHVRDHMRSIPLAQLRCFEQIDGIDLYSLQKGPNVAADIAASGLNLADLGQHFDDLCDTAAAISHLDLIISVDTSVAHLAGALAKPVWLMIADPPDWRWLLAGDHTPWYPTMRLFRQTKRNRWESVVEAIESELRELINSRSDCITTPALPREADAQVPSDHDTYDHQNTSSAPANLCRVDETRYGIVQYPPQIGPVAASLQYYGEYLHPQFDLMSRFIRPGASVLDLDVGIGISTLSLADIVGGDGHVVAFEQDRILNQIARQNLAANRVRNVTLLMREVGKRPSETSAAGEIVDGRTDNRDWLDGLGLERVDWIRINNGSRCHDILSAAEETLWRARPWIFTCGSQENELDAVAGVTDHYGYQSWRIETRFFSPENYNQRTDDIFNGRKAYAVLSVPEEIEMDITIEGCTRISVN